MKRPYSPPKLTKYKSASDLPQHLRSALVGKLTMIVDEQKTFKFVSDSFARTLGYAPNEMIGKRIDDITVEHSMDVDFVFRAFLQLGEMDGLWLCRHRDGRNVLFHFHARVSSDGMYADMEPLALAA